MNSVAIALHAIAATVWVGGMFFVLVVFRPAVQTLEPASRAAMMSITLKKFFPWVWMAIIVLLLTGYWLVGAFGGFGSVPAYVHIMHLLGWIMVALFGYMYFKPNKAFRVALEKDDKDQAMKALGTVRNIVLINFGIGLAIIAIVTGGRYS